MMSTDHDQLANKVLGEILNSLEIPELYYEKAVSRYQSIANWFHRKESTINCREPVVYPQGSFRLGTVIRPIDAASGYDLDLVCKISSTKQQVTQEELKNQIGKEVRTYSRAQNFKQEPEEGKRCWTQSYQDEVDFHLDILPSIPEELNHVRHLVGIRVPQECATEALAITDRTHENYRRVHQTWPSSNPKGYAIWFESRMDLGGHATQRRRMLQSNRAYASTDSVPAYKLKTPLQRCVQLLKRHRDVLFQNDPSVKPISIILTTLSAMAYRGESDVATAISRVLSDMESYIRDRRPRIPNPVDPEEDFADQWNQKLENCFRSWVRQAKHDFEFTLSDLSARDLKHHAEDRFAVSLHEEALRMILPAAAAVPVTEKNISITTGPRSWGNM